MLTWNLLQRQEHTAPPTQLQAKRYFDTPTAINRKREKSLRGAARLRSGTVTIRKGSGRKAKRANGCGTNAQRIILGIYIGRICMRNYIGRVITSENELRIPCVRTPHRYRIFAKIRVNGENRIQSIKRKLNDEITSRIRFPSSLPFPSSSQVGRDSAEIDSIS